MSHWLHVRGMSPDTLLSEVVRTPGCANDVQKAVDYANQEVYRAESIRQFRLLESEFNDDSGLLTPSMKSKCHAVTAAYAEEIEALYHS